MRSAAKRSAFSVAAGTPFLAVGDFLSRDAQVRGVQVEAVEAAGEFEQRLIAARDDIGDDRGDGFVHIGRGFALAAQEFGELSCEFRFRLIEPDGHCSANL